MARSYSYTPAVYDANVIATLLGVARERALGVDHQLAALSCGIVEDNLNHSDNVRDGTSVGWRQETRSSYPPPIDRMDLPASVNRFYDELGSAKPANRTIGSWVQSVQRSAYPDEYDAALPIAQQVLDAFTAGTPFEGGTLAAGSRSGGDGYTGPPLPPPPGNRPTLEQAEVALNSPVHGPTEIRFGGGEEGWLTASILTATVRRSIDEAATLEVTLHDPDRRAIRSPVLQTETVATVAGVKFALVKVDGTSPPLVTCTFVDVVAEWLMRPGGPAGAAPAGTVTRGGWIRQLVEESLAVPPGLPGIVTEIEEGDWIVSGTMGRGNEQDPDEPVLDATARAAGDVGWRRFVDLNRFVAGSDEFLHARFHPIRIREFRDPTINEPATTFVGYIRFSYSTLLQAETASFTCEAALWSSPPGSAVEIPNMGVATGAWVIETVERTLGSTETQVTLTRQRVELPEPIAEPPAPAGGGVPSGPGATSAFAGAGQVSPDFVAVARASVLAYPDYVWAATSERQSDCSGMIVWALGHVGGPTIPRNSMAQLAHCRDAGLEIGIEDARSTYGALVFRTTGNPTHVAISNGDGTTTEARGNSSTPERGVFDMGSRFDAAALIPGVTYA